MERGVRSLIRLSRMMRGTKILTNYAAATQSVQWGCASYTRGKAFINDFKPVNNVETPMVYRDAKDIFDEIRKNEANLSSVDATRFLQMLYKQDSDMTLKDIREREEFLLLCTKINKGIRELNVLDVVIAVRSLHYFNVSSKTLIMQTLLQLMRVSVNEIPFWWIPNLHRDICEMDSTPLVNALRNALPIVFNLNIRGVNRLPLVKQILCLHFAHEHNSANTMEIVVESLLNVDQEINAKSCVQILNILHQTPATKQSTKLCEKLVEPLVHGMKDLVFMDVYRFLRLYRLKCHSQMDPYSERIFDTICNTAMNNFTFMNILNLQYQFNLVQYTNIPMMDYLAAKIFEDPSICENVEFYLIAHFVKALVIADYKPIFWDYVLQIILQSIKRKYTDELILIRTTLRMIALDSYDESLLQHVFSIPIRNLQMPVEQVKLKSMLLLYQGIKTLYPMYTGPWPDSEAIKICMSATPSPVPNPFRAVLECALGGPQYVKSHLKTKLGQSVDHMVVIERDGRPIAINETDTSNINEPTYTYIEDVEIPSSSNAILIFNFPSYAYSMNTRRLNSERMLKVRAVEAYTGYSAIVLNCFTWNNLKEAEKISYVKQAIKLRAHDITMSPHIQ